VSRTGQAKVACLNGVAAHKLNRASARRCRMRSAAGVWTRTLWPTVQSSGTGGPDSPSRNVRRPSGATPPILSRIEARGDALADHVGDLGRGVGQADLDRDPRIASLEDDRVWSRFNSQLGLAYFTRTTNRGRNL
jgi:hypothetical protein